MQWISALKTLSLRENPYLYFYKYLLHAVLIFYQHGEGTGSSPFLLCIFFPARVFKMQTLKTM